MSKPSRLVDFDTILREKDWPMYKKLPPAEIASLLRYRAHQLIPDRGLLVIGPDDDGKALATFEAEPQSHILCVVEGMSSIALNDEAKRACACAMVPGAGTFYFTYPEAEELKTRHTPAGEPYAVGLYDREATVPELVWLEALCGILTPRAQFFLNTGKDATDAARAEVEADIAWFKAKRKEILASRANIANAPAPVLIDLLSYKGAR
jgi:hypothetical protein